jgi:outer membrane assembly lipoprotein YfiO
MIPMRFGCFVTAMIVLLTAAFAPGQTTLPTATPPATPPPAAEFRDGKWQPVQPAATPAAAAASPASDSILDHAQQLLTAKDPVAAQTVALYWIKTHDNKAPGRDRAIFIVAQAKYAIAGWQDWLYSFYWCDEVLDEYPDSKYFNAALDLQYKIADAYLSGKKDEFLGLGLIGEEDEAVEMLYRIQARVPGSPLAQKCLLRTADYYYAHGDFELAHDTYGYFIKSFPRAKQVPQAKLRQAFSSLAQFKGIRFDPTALYNARTELVDFSMAYPEMAEEENVAGIISRIDQALARKLFVTAEYYRNTQKWHGAVYMYRYLILTYPNAVDVPEARRRLAGMPGDALKDAQPRPGTDYTPPGDPTQAGGAP